MTLFPCQVFIDDACAPSFFAIHHWHTLADALDGTPNEAMLGQVKVAGVSFRTKASHPVTQTMPFLSVPLRIP